MLSTLPEAVAEEVLVERVAYLGFEVRVELVAADGRHFDAQLTHDEAERLELARGQIVYARLARASASGSPRPSTDAARDDNEIDPASPAQASSRRASFRRDHAAGSVTTSSRARRIVPVRHGLRARARRAAASVRPVTFGAAQPAEGVA